MKRGRYFRIIVLMIAVLLYTQNLFAWWNTEIVNFDISTDPYPQSTYVGVNKRYSNFSVAIGNDSIIHITYVDLPESNLVYSYKDKNQWHTEIVDHGITYLLGYATWQKPSIALDSKNNPHISYDNKYAHRDGEWHVEVVEGILEHGSSLIALDAHDRPHIISGESSIRYSYKDNSEWITEILDSYGEMPSTIAFDAKDNLHFAYYCSSDWSVKYAYKDSTGWHVEIVDDNAGGIRQVIFVLDSSGNPHICYNPRLQNELFLKYAHKDGTGWHIEILEEANVDDLSLVLATNDNPHVLYSVIENNVTRILKYTYKDSTIWHTEVVLNYSDFSGLVGHPANSMILDSNNHPHVTYCSNWLHSGGLVPFAVLYRGILKYVDKVDSEWKTHVLDEGFMMQVLDVFNYTNFFTIMDEWDETPVMIRDGLGNPHIFFRDGYRWKIGMVSPFHYVTTLKHAF